MKKTLMIIVLVLSLSLILYFGYNIDYTTNRTLSKHNVEKLITDIDFNAENDSDFEVLSSHSFVSDRGSWLPYDFYYVYSFAEIEVSDELKSEMESLDKLASSDDSIAVLFDELVPKNERDTWKSNILSESNEYFQASFSVKGIKDRPKSTAYMYFITNPKNNKIYLILDQSAFYLYNLNRK